MKKKMVVFQNWCTSCKIFRARYCIMGLWLGGFGVCGEYVYIGKWTGSGCVCTREA